MYAHKCAVTCRLHFWQNDQDLLHPTVVMWVQQTPKLVSNTRNSHFCYRNIESAFSHTRSLVLEGLITSTISGATDAGVQAEVETFHACHQISRDLE